MGSLKGVSHLSWTAEERNQLSHQGQTAPKAKGPVPVGPVVW